MFAGAQELLLPLSMDSGHSLAPAGHAAMGKIVLWPGVLCSDSFTVNQSAHAPCAVHPEIPQTSELLHKLVCADDFPAGGMDLSHLNLSEECRKSNLEYVTVKTSFYNHKAEVVTQLQSGLSWKGP